MYVQMLEPSDWSALHSDLCIPWEKISVMHLTERLVALSAVLIPVVQAMYCGWLLLLSVL
jgi:hypothetical protein